MGNQETPEAAGAREPGDLVYVNVPMMLRRDPQLSRPEAEVCAVILIYVGQPQGCYGSNAWIARQVGYSACEVSRAISGLKRKGKIRQEFENLPRGGYRRCLFATEEGRSYLAGMPRLAERASLAESAIQPREELAESANGVAQNASGGLRIPQQIEHGDRIEKQQQRANTYTVNRDWTPSDPTPNQAEGGTGVPSYPESGFGATPHADAGPTPNGDSGSQAQPTPNPDSGLRIPEEDLREKPAAANPAPTAAAPEPPPPEAPAPDADPMAERLLASELVEPPQARDLAGIARRNGRDLGYIERCVARAMTRPEEHRAGLLNKLIRENLEPPAVAKAGAAPRTEDDRKATADIERTRREIAELKRPVNPEALAREAAEEDAWVQALRRQWAAEDLEKRHREPLPAVEYETVPRPAPRVREAALAGGGVG